MAEDPKRLTRAHKIALGVISAACCCLIGVSAFTLAAPDALSQVQDNQAEATQEADSASTDYGNDAPQEGQSDNATQDGNAQDESSSASAARAKALKRKTAPRAAPATRQALPATVQAAMAIPKAQQQAPPLLAPLRCRYPFPAAPPMGAFQVAPTPPSRRALPPTMPCAPPAFRLARRAASTGST